MSMLEKCAPTAPGSALAVNCTRAWLAIDGVRAKCPQPALDAQALLGIFRRGLPEPVQLLGRSQKLFSSRSCASSSLCARSGSTTRTILADQKASYLAECSAA